MEPERDEPRADAEPDEERDDSRAGGDAEAAGSVDERESVARDDDDPFDPDD